MKIQKFVCIIVICFISCSTNKKANNCNTYFSEDYIPIDLYDAVEYLNCQWSEEEKQEFARVSEDDLVRFHFSIGMWIRNNWIRERKGEELNDLAKFFFSYEIFSPDGMSGFILTSFHRKLNNKDIDFEGQVEYYHNYPKLMQEFEEKETKRVLEAFDKYMIGDSITIYMEVDTIRLNARAGIGLVSYKWIYNPENDLELKGKIIQKEIIGDSVNIRMLIQVIDMNKTIEVLGESLNVGDTTEMFLRYLKYE